MENDPRIDEFIRAMTPDQKFRAAARLYYSARTMKAAWFRDIHPEWSDEKIAEETRHALISANG